MEQLPLELHLNILRLAFPHGLSYAHTNKALFHTLRDTTEYKATQLYLRFGGNWQKALASDQQNALAIWRFDKHVILKQRALVKILCQHLPLYNETTFREIIDQALHWEDLQQAGDPAHVSIFPFTLLTTLTKVPNSHTVLQFLFEQYSYRIERSADIKTRLLAAAYLPKLDIFSDILASASSNNLLSYQDALHYLIMQHAPAVSIQYLVGQPRVDLHRAALVAITASDADTLHILKYKGALPSLTQLQQREPAADVDTIHRYNTLILIATHPNTLRILLEQGYDPNVSEGQRLRTACSRGETEIVRALLEFGANPHVNDDGPLIYACTNGYQDIVELLLRYGADARAVDDTPLLTAITYGHVGITRLLLEHGADPHARNGEPLRMARRKWDHTLINLLKDELKRTIGDDTETTPQAEQKVRELLQDMMI